jgi:hypothetical protein
MALMLPIYLWFKKVCQPANYALGLKAGKLESREARMILGKVTAFAFKTGLIH